MIIVKLMCGLGNQLFQYALARRLSLLHNVPLKLDISHFETNKLRKYSLNYFNIREDFAEENEIAAIKGKRIFNLKRFAEKLIPYYNRSHVCEQKCGFDPNILKSQKNVYLEGYWQSELYFKEIEDIIRREFTFKNEADAVNKRITSLIDVINSVSLHIRRADYALEPLTNQFHGTCSLAYYEQAADIIAQRFPSPHFFVFSDDILWVKSNLLLKYQMTFISHNNTFKDYDDLRLMTHCKHHIIANSSFSWWGAWLSKNPDKMVIAPRKWFSDQNIDTKDLVPENWIRI